MAIFDVLAIRLWCESTCSHGYLGPVGTKHTWTEVRGKPGFGNWRLNRGMSSEQEGVLDRSKKKLEYYCPILVWSRSRSESGVTESDNGFNLGNGFNRMCTMAL